MNKSFIQAIIVGCILLIWMAICFSQPAPTPVLSQASDISTSTSSFNQNLSASDNTVQKALDTLDNLTAGGGTWGSITGTLSNQTDLQSALDAKISSQWATQSTVNVSLAGGNVGIGTTQVVGAALSVMNGNVGIGTWKPINMIQVTGGAAIGYSSSPANVAPTGGLIVSGNVGIGSTIPIRTLDVNGGIRAIAGQDNSFGSNVGIGTAAPQNPLAVVGGVGIGTLANSNFVKNVLASNVVAVEGNVGIGTWKPAAALEVKGGDVYIDKTSGKLIFVSPDGSCSSCGPDNSDAFACAGVTCPASP